MPKQLPNGAVAITYSINRKAFEVLQKHVHTAHGYGAFISSLLLEYDKRPTLENRLAQLEARVKHQEDQ